MSSVPETGDGWKEHARAGTEGGRSEEALRESEERYRAVVETSPDGIVVHRDGRFVFVNSAGAGMFGAGSPDELVGRRIMDFVHPDFHGRVAERVRGMLEEGKRAPLLEERFLRLDGSVIDVEVAASPITFAGERAVLVVFRDVTDRRRIERALREAEARYRTLVEQLPAVVYVGEYGEQGDWLYISPQIERVLGYTPQEWLTHPHPMASFTHPDDLARFRAAEERSRGTGGELSMEVRMRTKDGRWVWILHEATALRDGEGRPIFLQGLMHDVTERKRVEEKLRESEALVHKLFGRVVQAQEEERARIADDIHDDSIQAVTAVGLRLRALRNRLTDEASMETVAKLEVSVEAAIARMRHLLFELRPRTLDEDGLAPTLRLYLDRMATETGIDYEIVNRLGQEPPSEVRIALYRIAQEALVNVHKHGKASKVDVLLEARERGYFVRIRDDGGGFDIEAVQSAPGHLGLSSMRERAEMSGGWCWVHSAPGHGTTVEFWLPSPDRKSHRAE